MRKFYDYRGLPPADAQKFPIEGKVILKSKKYWLCWIYKDPNWFLERQKLSKGFIVAPRTIYLYDIYIATSFWNALKYFIKVSFKKKTK
jgi:hypothetical protein